MVEAIGNNFALNTMPLQFEGEDILAVDNMINGIDLFGNQRYTNAMMGQMNTIYHNYETNDILTQDKETLEPMAETLHEYRIFGKRYWEQDRVAKLFTNNDMPSGNNKISSLYLLYCAKYGGLKDENKPVNFSNLKDPGLLIKHSRNVFALTAKGAYNTNIEKLTEAAIESHNPELAAQLLLNSGKGFGVDDKTVKAILIDSKNNMDEVTYNRFIMEVANAYEKSTGDPIDKLIRAQYPSIPGIEVSWFGANKQGKSYLNIIDTARQTTSSVNTNVFGMTGLY